jgi:succinate dehydrogenase/fumarate reductase flavoprotein subunit
MSTSNYGYQEQNYDEEFDVVVVGYGFAGGVSAIEAHDAGAKVLLIEKMPDPGGISICSHGAICSTRNPEGAFTYLKHTNAGRTPDSVLRALAEECKIMKLIRESCLRSPALSL